MMDGVGGVLTFTPNERERAKMQSGKKFKKSGYLRLDYLNLEKRHSMLDYIKGGCEIGLTIAIDYTASNGAPTTATSLHYHNNMSYNQYQKAIISIGEILREYDSDKAFPVFGFGGQVGGETNHCFPLTFDESHPEVNDVKGIMNAYNNSFNYVRLSGPTKFSHIIQRASRDISSVNVTQEKQQYSILLILTDGVINDLDQTVQEIVEGSKLPLSIVIVGVGNADFSAMEILDGDSGLLKSRYGGTAARDIVQFVNFNKYSSNASLLAKETLMEIPKQLMDYFSLKKIVPNVALPPVFHGNTHSAVPSMPVGAVPVVATAAVPGIPMAAYGHGTPVAAIPVASIPASAAYPQAQSYR
jgi:vacuolar-type H+-ATPase subunit F/Vma7